MGLTGALQIGRTALMASQTALEVVGNNLANVATRGYHRQEVSLTPVAPQADAGLLIGRGVQVEQIIRRVDEALESRIRAAGSEQSGSAATYQILSQIEGLENELDTNGNNVSGYLSAFFGAWTQLQGQPTDAVFRNQVLVQGEQLASYLQSLRSDLTGLRQQVDQSLTDTVTAANNVLNQIETLNRQIMQAERGQGGANALRDQRDQLLTELASYLDISVSEQANGMVDVYVGSLPVVLNGASRGLELARETVDGELRVSLRIVADKSVLNPQAGKIGALMRVRESEVQGAIDSLDAFTRELIWQVNRIHSQGQGDRGLTAVTAERAVTDTNAVLSSSDLGLPFSIGNGSFDLQVKQTSTGAVRTYKISILGNGTSDDSTLATVAADLNSRAGVSATIDAQGRLHINAESGDYQIFFANDTSGVLAALGINSFFSGVDARDIGLREGLTTENLAVKLGAESNGNAKALGKLATTNLEALGGVTLGSYWNRHVAELAQRISRASQQQQADTVVLESLQAQQQSVSGVNTDEEAINLLAYQRAYQGSARFLTVVDELMQTLLSLVG